MPSRQRQARPAKAILWPPNRVTSKVAGPLITGEAAQAGRGSEFCTLRPSKSGSFLPLFLGRDREKQHEGDGLCRREKSAAQLTS
jgi:hypothetical protein